MAQKIYEHAHAVRRLEAPQHITHTCDEMQKLNACENKKESKFRSECWRSLRPKSIEKRGNTLVVVDDLPTPMHYKLPYELSLKKLRLTSIPEYTQHSENERFIRAVRTGNVEYVCRKFQEVQPFVRVMFANMRTGRHANTMYMIAMRKALQTKDPAMKFKYQKLAYVLRQYADLTATNNQGKTVNQLCTQTVTAS
jgi:hypothetical protein